MTVIRQTLVVVAALAAVLAALFGALCGVVLLVNRADQPPSPAALELARAHEARPDVADEDNAFVYLLGFTAHRDDSPAEVGAERASWLRAMRATPAYVSVEPPPSRTYSLTELRERIAPAASFIENACTSPLVGAQCYQSLSAAEAELPAWLEAQEWLLERYRVLIAHEQWREIGTDDHRTPWLWLQNALVGQQVLMLEAWRLAAAGDAEGLGRLLEADLSFWRRALAASDHLVAKTAIASQIGIHFRWGNIVLKRVPEERALDAIPPSWRRPLDVNERSILRPLAREQRYTRKALDTFHAPAGGATAPGRTSFVDDLASALLARTLQRQDTVNRRAATLLAVAEAFDVPVEEYPEALSMMRVFEPPGAGSGLGEAMYNLSGKLLLGSASDVVGMLVRPAAASGDLEGVRRMALFAAEMRAAGVADVPLALELSLPELRDPYTGQPFGWDESSGLLIFRGLQDFRVRYGVYY